MSIKETLEQRIVDITKAITDAAATHNSLVGRLQEAQYIIGELDSFLSSIVPESTDQDAQTSSAASPATS